MTGADLVALRMPNGAAFVDALDAAWEAGDAVLPVHPKLPGPEVRRVLGELRPSRLVEPDGVTPLADPVPVEPGTALVVPTSGTTGSPKGVELTHDALAASALATIARLGLTGADRWLCCVPMSYVAGLMVLAGSAGVPGRGGQVTQLVAADGQVALPLRVGGVGARQPGGDVEGGLIVLAGGGGVPGRAGQVTQPVAADGQGTLPLRAGGVGARQPGGDVEGGLIVLSA